MLTRNLQNSQTQTAFTPESDNSNIKPVSYTVYSSKQKDCGANTVEDYAACVSQDLYKLWIPPKSGRHTQSIIIVQVAPDGSLLNYRFAKKSGDEITDRSVMSAVEQNVLYPKFPTSENSADYLTLQFVFEYKLFKKSVM